MQDLQRRQTTVNNNLDNRDNRDNQDNDTREGVLEMMIKSNLNRCETIRINSTKNVFQFIVSPKLKRNLIFIYYLYI